MSMGCSGECWKASLAGKGEVGAAKEVKEQGVLIPSGARRPHERLGNCILSVMKYFWNDSIREVL